MSGAQRWPLLLNVGGKKGLLEVSDLFWAGTFDPNSGPPGFLFVIQS